MYEFLLILFLIVSLSLIGIVLLQQGKGADMGASFGSGASGTVFGSSGAGNFLTRTTAILATSFLILSLILGYLSTNRVSEQDAFLDGLSKAQNTVAEPAVANDAVDVPAEETAAPVSEAVSEDVPVE